MATWRQVVTVAQILAEELFPDRTTAAQVLKDKDLTGQVALVTGGNSGIGKETVRVLVEAGAKVIFTARQRAIADAVAEEIQAQGLQGQAIAEVLDLADLHSVQALASRLQQESRLDMLIFNAGVMACPLGYTAQGFEMQIGTNHFGHFLLFQLLEAKLAAQAALGRETRIVSVSSSAQKGGRIDLEDLHFTHGRQYHPVLAYGQSKVANVLFAKEIAARHAHTPLRAYAAHPGAVDTNLMRHGNPASQVSWVAYLLWRIMRPFRTKTIPQGASTQVLAATASELEGQSGAYLRDCRVVPAGEQASDLELAHRLWLVTAEQIQTALAEPAH